MRRPLTFLLGFTIATASLANADLSEWEELPLYGGNINEGLIIDPNDPSYLLAIASGHLIETRDGGESWSERVVPESADLRYLQRP